MDLPIPLSPATCLNPPPKGEWLIPKNSSDNINSWRCYILNSTQFRLKDGDYSEKFHIGLSKTSKVFTLKDRKDTVSVIVRVTASGNKDIGKEYYEPSYQKTITITKSDIKPMEKAIVLNPPVADSAINYDDVFIDFQNKSDKNLTIKVGTYGTINVEKDETKPFHLQSKDPQIPLSISFPDAQEPALFTKTHATVSKMLRNVIYPQAPIPASGPVDYHVKLSVRPKHERAKRWGTWNVRYLITINVDKVH